jgi:tetratricopeptide (TPR) repeat protein
VTDLRERLFAAPPDLLAELCERHRAEIVASFQEWGVLPEPLRGDREAAESWLAALIRIGEQLERLGEPQPLAWLYGEGRDDPFAKWNAALAHADELSAAGRPEEAIAVMRSVLESLEGSSGPIVDDLLAKTRGKMAVALLALGDVGGARAFTLGALEASVSTGDLFGISAYRENLDVIDAVVGDERLASLRAQLAEAQDLSDAGRFAAAQALLEELAGRDDVGRYAGKFCGLFGLNLYRLGDFEGAHAWTQAALDACDESDDLHGMIIYAENLRRIDESRRERQT